MRLTTFILISISLLALTTKIYSQNNDFCNKMLGQDSSILHNRKLWIDFSFGPSITLNPDGLDLLLFGPTIDFTYIDRNYQLIKIKTSYHQGFAIFENFSQYTGEFDFMTGRIKTKSNHTTEFYYGLGLIAGRKRSEIISSSNGGNGGGFFVNLPWTEYEKKDFIFIGIPFEYKIQWSIVGLGIDGNLNPYLPYFGTKLYIKIGNKYKKQKPSL